MKCSFVTLACACHLICFTVNADSFDLDANPPMIKGSFSVGSLPRSVAIFGNRGFVSNFSSSNISYFDASSMTPTQLGTFPVSSSPAFITIFGTTGYVACRGENKIDYFDASSSNPRVLGSILTSSRPSQIAIQGTTGYVACLSGALDYIDMTTNPPLKKGSLILGGNLRNLAVSGNKGFCADFESGNINVFSATPIPVLTGTFYSGQSPYYLAVSGTTGYVCNFNTPFISYFDATSNQPSKIGEFISGFAPAGLAFSGSIGYVANQGSNNVSYFYTDVFPLVTAGEISGGLNQPVSVAIGGSASYGYVTNYPSNNVSYFTLAPPYVPPPPPPVIKLFGNAGVTSDLLNKINGNCLQSTQRVYNNIIYLPDTVQANQVAQITPKFKVIQYSLEKLDLLVHKELEEVFYSDHQGTTPFLIAGFDNLNQSPSGGEQPYQGYNVDTYYQLLGACSSWGRMTWLYGLGAAESYMTLNPADAEAKYPTAYVFTGVSGHHNRWLYGLDSLFGYSFIDAKRKIEYLNLEAKTDHGAWNLSFDAKIAYKIAKDNAIITPYDNLSYLYGHENEYQEKQASGVNFKVKNENISFIRNILGFKIDAPKDSNVKIFMDFGWLYEHDFYKNNFLAAFEGTDVYGTYHQQRPVQNYGRVNAGVYGDHHNFGWKLSYTGLFGSRYRENSGSLLLKYSF